MGNALDLSQEVKYAWALCCLKLILLILRVLVWNADSLPIWFHISLRTYKGFKVDCFILELYLVTLYTLASIVLNFCVVQEKG